MVDTSEFHDVRQRLIMIGNRLKLREEPGRPVLHTRPSTKVEQAGTPEGEDEDRPKLTRRN